MEQITELEEEVKALSSSQTAFVRDFQPINKDISLNVSTISLQVAAVKNRRERLIKERMSLEESKRVAQERLDRLESFICANLGGHGWKIKVGWVRIQFENVCDTFHSSNTVINREN